MKDIKLDAREIEAAQDGTLIWHYGPKKGQPIGVQEVARRKLELAKENYMSELEIIGDKLNFLRAGEKVVYGFAGPKTKDGPASDVNPGLKKLAWNLFMAGRLHLVQRKMPNGYQYIAVGAIPPYKPVKFKGCYIDNPRVAKTG